MAVLKEVNRFRYCLSRHIQVLAGFSSIYTCDRRLKLLFENNFLSRERVLYGYPYIYTASHKGKSLIGASTRPDKIRIDLIPHNVAVLDSVCYFIINEGVSLEDIITEKELYSIDGFKSRTHKPDFVIHTDNQIVAVEVELSTKAKDTLQKNIHSNFLNYEGQTWIISKFNSKIKRNIDESINQYPNFRIFYIEDM